MRKEDKVEIRIGNLKLRAKAGPGTGETRIIVDTVPDATNQIDVDSKELKVAIEALEKTCWRP